MSRTIAISAGRSRQARPLSERSTPRKASETISETPSAAIAADYPFLRIRSMRRRHDSSGRVEASGSHFRPDDLDLVGRTQHDRHALVQLGRLDVEDVGDAVGDLAARPFDDQAHRIGL